MLDDGAARAQGPIMKHCLTCVAVSILMAVTSGGLAGTTYRVVPEKSSLRIEVGKGGAFGFVAGHTHEVEGRIQGRVTADARDLSGAEIQLTIGAADLRVSGKGEPPADVPKVQERMLGPDVLDVARFPEITFRSTSVAVGEGRSAAADVRVTGELTLHGRTKSIATPVRVHIDGGSLTELKALAEPLPLEGGFFHPPTRARSACTKSQAPRARYWLNCSSV